MSFLGGRVCRAATSLCALTARSQPCCYLSTSVSRQRRRSKFDYMDVAAPYDDIDWNIRASVCFARAPQISQSVPAWAATYTETVDAIESERAIPSKHDERMERFKKMNDALEKRAAGETVTDFTQQELAGDEVQTFKERVVIEEEELGKYTPASRETQDDRDKVLTSTNRLLHRYLYLIVRHKSDILGWSFPQVDVCGTIALREEAAKLADSLCNPKMEYEILCNSPSGYLSILHPTENGMKGSKVFVYMAQMGSTSMETLSNPDYLEYRWLPVEGIKKLMSRDQYRGVHGMMME